MAFYVYMKKIKIKEKTSKCKCCGRQFAPDDFYYEFCRECSYKWEYEIK